MDINVANNTEHSIYHLITQLIIPRPVAWVLTESAPNNYNIAPFSFFTPVCSEPPLLMFSVGKKPNCQPKDTTTNVQKHGKMVIHIASMDLAEVVTQTSATLEHGDSELDANQLELVEFNNFDLPRVKVCDIALGCHLYQTQSIGTNDQTLIFAQIEHIYINDQVINLSQSDRLTLDALKIDPLGRLGGIEFGKLTQILKVPRPS